jgi:NADH-quinone oxidoreductase subunit F/NADP-reducing hydrogenase subunit HndC
MCARNCPVDAIVKTDTPAKNPRLMAYRIIPEKCIKCGTCVSKCPAKPKAIIK